MKVDVWSDIACPWCWLGKHHLEEALRRTGIEAEVEFHSYELDPHVRGVRPVRAYFADERPHALPSIVAAQERLTEMGRRIGITFDFERQLVANTFDAHRLHHLGKSHGLGETVVERLMRARHGEGADTSDRDALRRLAVEVGLDAAVVDEVLEGDRFAAEVRADEALAVKYGIQGVPFFVFDGRLAVSGAQPVEQFERALREAQVLAR